MVQKTRLGSLDFIDIKDSIKNYLSAQTEFTDYSLEGSGITQIINVLAYNAHYDALAANFLANEVFLDTATKRSSVVSRAKELGYVPRSRRASTTTLSVSLRNISNEGTINSVILPKGSRFSAKVGDEFFTYTTREAVSLGKIIEFGSPVFRGSVSVYEGVLTQHSVIYNNVDNTVSIPNLDIDTSTLKVEVLEGVSWVEYTQPSNFLTVLPTSNAYMLQEGFSGFEIYFGDNILGKQPANASNIRMTYVVTSGDIANGAINFSLVSAVSGTLSNTIVTIVTALSSAGGQQEESMESIRLNAKSTFSTQNRAVTASDYAGLASQNFPSIRDVLAWDGSDNVPPKFGKVILCVQPAFGDVLSATEKTLLAEFLQNKSVGNVKVDFVDPEYLNIELYSKIKYNSNELNIGVYELSFIAKLAITEYISTSIQKFKGALRYSSLLGVIDAANYAITGNETTVKLAKILKPDLFGSNRFNFSYANQIKPGTLTSSIYFDGMSSNRLYMKDSSGKIHSYYSLNGIDILHQANIGTINYTTGNVTLSSLYVSSLDGTKLRISATPVNLDVSSSKNIILTLSQEDITIEVNKDTE